MMSTTILAMNPGSMASEILFGKESLHVHEVERAETTEKLKVQ